MAADTFLSTMFVGDDATGLRPKQMALVVDGDHFTVSDVPDGVATGAGGAVTGYTFLQLKADAAQDLIRKTGTDTIVGPVAGIEGAFIVLADDGSPGLSYDNGTGTFSSGIALTFPGAIFTTVSEPSSPAAGSLALFTTNGTALKTKNHAGTVVTLGAGGGGPPVHGTVTSLGDGLGGIGRDAGQVGIASVSIGVDPDSRSPCTVTVEWSTPFADANYAFLGTAYAVGGSAYVTYWCVPIPNGRTTNSCTFRVTGSGEGDPNSVAMSIMIIAA